MHFIFSTSDAEELVVVTICLLLDRQLLGLSVEINECIQSLVNFFTEDEWHSSCEKIAKSVALRFSINTTVSFIYHSKYSLSSKNKNKNCYIYWLFENRVPMDINSLRAIECIPAVCGPTKHLRSAIAFQVLIRYFDKVYSV